MLLNEQEYIFKDFFIIFSAIFGLVILIAIQLKNLGLRLRPLGRRKSDLNKFTNIKQQNPNVFYAKYWTYSNTSFEINIEDYYLVWYISHFNIKKRLAKNNIQKINGHFWYKFSNSKTKTEKIILPIYRKIFHKYKNKLESEKSIQLISLNYEDPNLYTWLKTETQLHTAIYTFLEECMSIANELNIKPSLIVTLSDCITIDILLPHHELILLFEKEFRELYAVDFIVAEEDIKITLWIAFSQNKVPDICLNNYSKAKISLENYKKVS